SKIYFREFNQSEDSQGSYTVVNLNAIWESNDGLWTGRLFAKNLTDEDYITGLVGSSSNGGRLGSWGPPRQVGLEVTRYFGSL
ncbi:MAG: TonB-dependent receptor, partial [Gammaproteobacteria bacterium]